MLQTTFITLFALLFFVFLFISIYRKRQSGRLLFWIFGWMSVVVHFCLLLWQSPNLQLERVLHSLATGALLLCGGFFLLSSSMFNRLHQQPRRAGGIAALFFALACAYSFAWQPIGVFLGLGLALQVLGLVLFWRCRMGKLSLVVPGTVLIFLCGELCGLEAFEHHTHAALSVLLMETFALYALVFAHEFTERTAGAVTTLIGLLGWALVFPASLGMAAYFPTVLVKAELWNLPKVLVAFGMLVTLFEQELALTQQESEQYRGLFDDNPLPMWIFERESLRLLKANAAAVGEFGWTLEETQQRFVMDLLSPAGSPVAEQQERWLTHFRELSPTTRAAAATAAKRIAMQFQTRRGDSPAVEVTLQPAVFQGVEAGLLIAKDVSVEKAEQAELLHRVHHDALTGLPNRLLLQDRMQTALAAAERYGTKLAVLCIDLDRFKLVNDTHGHAAGDHCLREAGLRLRQRLRAVDTAARTGGEEFMVILCEIGGRRDAELVAEKIVATLGAPHYWNGSIVHVSASVGIALCPEDAKHAPQLMNQADAAMYRAKQAGGNRFAFYAHRN